MIVVEHDEDAIRTADYVLDIGPGAGIHGGHIIAEGQADDVMANAELAHRPISLRRAEIADARAPAEQPAPHAEGRRRARQQPEERHRRNPARPVHLRHRRLRRRQVDAARSTRSTRRWRGELNGASEAPAPHDRIEGLEHLDKVIDIDQSPIGRTPRSNPATYTGAFTPIREWFAGLPEAKARGYEPGRFSFNVKGGRCEACQGDGVIKIEMHFLPDVYVTCDVCKGKRYNRETLEVLFKGKSIADVLDMTVEEALEFFKAVPRVRDVLDAAAPRRPRLHPCRPAGDDALRRRGAARQARQGAVASAPPAARSTSSTSRPPACTSTTWRSCSRCCTSWSTSGNTVVVIEHNLEVIKTADWIIDLGPEGGDGGGEIVAAGTPEDIVAGEAQLYGAVPQAGAGARESAAGEEEDRGGEE